MNSQYDLITFDCYGTLIAWESGIANAFTAAASQDDVTIDAGGILTLYMAEEPAVQGEGYVSYRDVLAETAIRVAAELGWQLTRERARFLADSLPGWQPFPDTNIALERLSQKFRLGILSNIDDDLLQATLSHFTVEFTMVVTAQQVRSYKPGLAHFNEALRRVGQDRLLHAAQSYYHDVVPATKLRIPVAWINRKGEQAERGGAQPTYEVPNLTALADVLGV
jgi:2-haloacid dehalogenase/putative hydrolase of the HAD superfamily